MSIQQRRLAAIMFTDIVGYTKLMGSDEKKAFQTLKKNRDIHKPIIKKHDGEWLKEMGDGILASFHNSSDAVRCAGEIQNEAKKEGIGLRIGIHEGEVVFEGNDVFGDGVNVASRLEQIADAGDIMISGSIYKDVKNKGDITTELVGERTLKNVDEPMMVYKAHYHPAQQESADTSPGKNGLNRKLYYFLPAFLVIAIVLILIWYNLPEKSLTDPEKSIVVLPFKNDSPDEENEYFCNGMMEEILTNLQKIGDLRVKSRTAAEKYRYQTRNITDIGKELNVAYVLEGSVRKMEDDLRITAQLIDAETGDHLWAETYDGKYTAQIFEFQSKTAKEVAGSLKAIITPEEEKRIDRIPTSNMLAHEMKLKGWEYIGKWTWTHDSSFLKLAIFLSEEALKLDPDYVDALGLKAIAFMYEGQYDSALYLYNRMYRMAPDHPGSFMGKGHLYMLYLNNMDSAFKYLNTAIKMTPNDPWANLAMGQIYYLSRNDIIRSLPYYAKGYALKGKSDAAMNLQMASLMVDISAYSMAEKYMKNVLNIRMECVMIAQYNYLLQCQQKYEESYQFLDSICNNSDCNVICSRQRFATSVLRQDMDMANTYYLEVPDDRNLPSFIGELMDACYFKETHREQKANTILESSIKRNLAMLKTNLNRRGESTAYWMLCAAHSMLNNKTKAIEFLGKLRDSGFFIGWQDYIGIFPAFENIWEEPEYKAIMKKVRDEKAALRQQIFKMVTDGELSL